MAFLYIVTTSRGCPYGCTYCYHSFTCKMRGKKDLRQRTVSNVIDELLWAKRKYKIKSVLFGDDSFTTNKKWLTNFLKLYKKKIGLPYSCEVNPTFIDRKTVQKLGSSGCVFVGMGIQSLSSRLSREVLNRVVLRRKIIQAIKNLKKAGIMIQVDHMFGIPGDTIKNQEKAVLFYNKHRPDLISVFWLTYYPKLPIIQTALNQGLLTLEDIKKIEQGKKITKTNFHTGGSLKNPDPYYSLQFLINYLPFLPKGLVKQLINTRLYRLFKIRNFYISTAPPRLIISVVDKRYLYGRFLLTSFFSKMVTNSLGFMTFKKND